MPTTKEAATEFLAHKRIAVTGVSRNAGGHGSNAVYQRLKQRGYEVFAVNPNAAEVEGDPTFPDLTSIGRDLRRLIPVCRELSEAVRVVSVGGGNGRGLFDSRRC